MAADFAAIAQELLAAQAAETELRDSRFRPSYAPAKASAAEVEANAAFRAASETAYATYKAEADASEALMNKVRREADEAHQAVYAKYAVQVAEAQKVIEAARKKRNDALEVANDVCAAVSRTASDARDVSYRAAMDRTRKAEVAVLLALNGGPLCIPAKTEHGRRYDFWGKKRGPANGIGIRYRLTRASKCHSSEATLWIDFPIYSDDKRLAEFYGPEAVPLFRAVFGPSGGPHHGFNLSVSADATSLPNAIREVEDKAIAEGWLVREEETKP